jgi:sn-glycerol 3-phosphate transport system substrate-binding protein
MKKLSIVLLLLIFSFSFVFANGTEEKAPVASVEEEVKPTGTTEVVWWTYFGKANVEYLQKVIDAFNESQTDYHVTIEYQGSQAEMIAKMQSTQLSDLPALFNCAIENIGMLIPADYCINAQEFMDKDKNGWPELENTYVAFRSAYSDQDGNLVGYPNGVSYPTIYYNKTLLAKAGIDPMSLTSTEEVYAACKKLVSEGYCSYGIGFHPDGGYYFNASLAREAVIAYDNTNGYTGDITKCLYTDGGKVQQAVTKYLEFYKKLYAEKLAVAYGSNYSSEIIPLLASGDCAMMMGVISMTTKVLSGVGSNFEVGVIPCPSVTSQGKRGGEPSGGTGLFIANNGNKWEMQGGYEFMKFCSKGEWAGYFASATGYLAPNTDAYNSEVYQNYLHNIFPAISVVYDSLSKSDDSAKMPLCAISSTIKSANKLAIETVANDPTDTAIQQAIVTAQETIQDAIDLYNLSN